MIGVIALIRNLSTSFKSNPNPRFTMKTAQIFGCLLLAVSSLTIARSMDSMPVLRVESSNTMKVAVINADQHNPANERLHKAFAASLGFQISQCYKTPIPVQAVLVDAQEASAGLSNGNYDLVAVIGAEVPSILLNSEFKRYKAVPTTGGAKYVVNLLVLRDDHTLSAMLDRSFETALNERFFQLAFASYRKSSVEQERTEWKIAVAALR
jgi:hypothetical protein